MTEQLGELCQNIHLVLDMLERQRDRLDHQERALLALQPRYDTLMHTFRNEGEAEMAWQFLQIALNGPDAKIDPMPRPACACIGCGSEPRKQNERKEGGFLGI